MSAHLRIAFRQHVRQRGFALTVVVTLALSLGATTAMFSVVDAVVFRGLPFKSPEQLVWIVSVRTDNPNAPFTLPEFVDYRSRTHTLSGLAAYANWSVSLAEDGVTEKLTGARMSANAFSLLGVSPAAGRLLTDADDDASAPPVVVLSYRLWQQRFGGAADAIGKTARINSESYAIVGVLPLHFPIPLLDLDAVTALAPDRDPLRHARGSANFLRFIARLNPGTDARTAQSELTGICLSLRQQFPVEYARKEAVSVSSLQDALVGDFRQPMLFLFGAVVVVLATALANLVSLSLVRANARRSELSTRVAFGAQWRQLAGQLAIEASLLAAAGAGFGWLLAAFAIATTKRWAPPSIPRLGDVNLDRTAGLVAALLMLVVTMLLTAVPLAANGRVSAGNALRFAARGAIGDRWSDRLRKAMVVAEISVAVVLMTATIVLAENLLRLQDSHLGFKPEGVFQARVAIPAGYRTADEVARFYEQLLGRLTQAPGVEHVGVISVTPLSGLILTVPFSVADRPIAERDRPTANYRAISADYLPTVGTRLVEGRPFSDSDRLSTPPVALVSAALADRFVGGRAVGRQIVIDDTNQAPRTLEIVGVVENVSESGLDLPPALDIYISLRQLPPDQVQRFRDNQFWMIRTQSPPAAFRATFLSHLRAVDPDAAVSSVGTMRQAVDAWLGPRRFNLGLFSAFTLTTVLLAVSGVYGLVSYVVSRRRNEIGLRMAMGASQRDVLRMILRLAVMLAVSGAMVGVAVVGALRRLAAGTIPNISVDPAIMVATSGLLVVFVLIAAWVPARNAARIDPTVALRSQ